MKKLSDIKHENGLIGQLVKFKEKLKIIQERFGDDYPIASKMLLLYVFFKAIDDICKLRESFDRLIIYLNEQALALKTKTNYVAIIISGGIKHEESKEWMFEKYADYFEELKDLLIVTNKIKPEKVLLWIEINYGSICDMLHDNPDLNNNFKQISEEILKLIKLIDIIQKKSYYFGVVYLLLCR